MQGAQVCSLLGELKSHMLRGAAKKLKNYPSQKVKSVRPLKKHTCSSLRMCRDCKNLLYLRDVVSCLKSHQPHESGRAGVETFSEITEEQNLMTNSWPVRTRGHVFWTPPGMLEGHTNNNFGRKIT